MPLFQKAIRGLYQREKEYKKNLNKASANEPAETLIVRGKHLMKVNLIYNCVQSSTQGTLNRVHQGWLETRVIYVYLILVYLLAMFAITRVDHA